MTLEERKSNIYFDNTGKQILAGDLLKVFHFKIKNRKYYMYHVVVMEKTKPFPVLSVKAHYSDKPHCRIYVLANNSKRVFYDAKIIAVKDINTKRQKIKI